MAHRPVVDQAAHDPHRPLEPTAFQSKPPDSKMSAIAVIYIFGGLVIFCVLYMARDIVFAERVHRGVKFIFLCLTLAALLLTILLVRSLETLMSALLL